MHARHTDDQGRPTHLTLRARDGRRVWITGGNKVPMWETSWTHPTNFRYPAKELTIADAIRMCPNEEETILRVSSWIVNGARARCAPLLERGMTDHFFVTQTAKFAEELHTLGGGLAGR